MTAIGTQPCPRCKGRKRMIILSGSASHLHSTMADAKVSAAVIDCPDCQGRGYVPLLQPIEPRPTTDSVRVFE